jgi:Domain of unknown function (DUF4188)
MNPTKLVALVLIVAGVLGLMYGSFSYTRQRAHVGRRGGHRGRRGAAAGRRPKVASRRSLPGLPAEASRGRLSVRKPPARSMIRPDRLTADLDGDFVVFLIGMRINKPLQVHKWLPVARAMPRMIAELYAHPELGFLHAESWFARTLIMVQYWRSMAQLLAYARNKDAAHLPAWQAFNRAIGTDGSVGVWHETYAASPGSHESVYVNMPPFGLGQAGALVPATAGRQSAAGRLKAGLHAP